MRFRLSSAEAELTKFVVMNFMQIDKNGVTLFRVRNFCRTCIIMICILLPSKNEMHMVRAVEPWFIP